MPSWTAVLSTPAHPEYSSAHAVLSSAAADAFSFIFGNSIGNFTDHTYDYLSFPARSFNSFQAIGEDAGYSRLYAGIHYLPTIKTGLWQGRKFHQILFQSSAGDRGIKNSLLPIYS
ncbi:MAG: hypothetical protein WDM78_10535 [Puia sp.]